MADEKDYHRLTHKRGREKFFNDNCSECKLEADCNMKKDIGESRELNTDELNDYFGLTEIDANSACDKMVPVDGDVVADGSPTLF